MSVGERAELTDGERALAWASEHMPVLCHVGARLSERGGVRGRRVGIASSLDGKTASLAVVLAAAGAEVAFACASASTDGGLAEALSGRGVTITDDKGVLDRRPEVVIDDGAALMRRAHTTRRDALAALVGAVELSAAGTATLRSMAADGTLAVPCIAAGEARCTSHLEARYGAGQAIAMAVLDRTNLLLAGTRLVVLGYGAVGRGLARRARGVAARVIVCETEVHAALEAHYDGFDVMPIEHACAQAQVLVTATGAGPTLPPNAVDLLPDGALITAAGYGEGLDLTALRKRALNTQVVRTGVEELRLGEHRSVFLIDADRGDSTSAAASLPIELMDLACSVHALAASQLLDRAAHLKPGVHGVPAGIDEGVARARLDTLGLQIDA